MKRTISLWMLLTGITINLCAQSTDRSDKAFDVPDNIVFTRRFNIDLSSGNKMLIEVTDITDLDKVGNIDSLLRVFLNDIAPLKDSLADPLTAKRIDYVTDAQNRKKIRFQQFNAKGTSFFINKDETVVLRTEQDTINLLGIVLNAPKPTTKISLKNPRYYHFVFYLNNTDELGDYMHGMLAEKIETIRTDVKDKWHVLYGTGSWYLKKDSTITAEKPAGYIAGTSSDQISGFVSVNVQNYKNYFVPSASVGLKLSLVNRERTYKWEPAILWEPNFLFSKDSSGKLQTYRNDFLTLMYEQGGIKDYNSTKGFSYSTAFSLGYLINRKGDFFDKNTFRLGAGKIRFYKTSVEPSIYFNNFFKAVTPGIRIMQDIF
jgi:hypothetical protein